MRWLPVGFGKNAYDTYTVSANDSDILWLDDSEVREETVLQLCVITIMQ
jgi:hypothetical protein